MIIMDENSLPPVIVPIAEFKKAYGDKVGYRKLMALVGGSLDDMSTIFLRVFIEESDQFKDDQKYVLVFRIYSFGRCATVDLISLNHKYHYEIFNNHLKNLGWKLPDSDSQVSFMLPYAFAGGFVKRSDLDFVFKGTSLDFGCNLFGYDVNDIASLIISMTDDENIQNKFFDFFMNAMESVKDKNNFYEKLFLSLTKNKSNKETTAQNLASLLAMKVFDELETNGKESNIFEVFVREVHSGLGRTIFLEKLADNFK